MLRSSRERGHPAQPQSKLAILGSSLGTQVVQQLPGAARRQCLKAVTEQNRRRRLAQQQQQQIQMQAQMMS